MDGERKWTGNGFAPCGSISVFPDVSRVVVTAGDAAAAAAQKEVAWRDVVVNAAGVVVAVIATTTPGFFDVLDRGALDVLPDAKAEAPNRRCLRCSRGS